MGLGEEVGKKETDAEKDSRLTEKVCLTYWPSFQQKT